MIALHRPARPCPLPRARRGLAGGGPHLALAAFAAIGLMTTACKDQTSSAGTASETPAQTVRLPDFAPVYPGATIRKQVTEATLGDAQGTMVVLDTADPIRTVAAFYDARAQEAGLKASLIVDEDDSAVRIYNSGGIDGKGGMISISPGTDGTGSSIVITAGQSAISAVERMALPAEERP